MLRQAAGEGRIDLEELDQRLEATYAAKTYGELVPITADLPVAGRRTRRPPRGRRRLAQPTGAALLGVGGDHVGDQARRRLGRRGPHSAFALMGSVVLDLRQAQFESDEVTINASAVMGEVKVLVDAGTTVVVEGAGVMGEYTEQRPRVPFDAELRRSRRTPARASR